MFRVANVFDVNFHHTLDRLVAEELHNKKINEETPVLLRNHWIMDSMVKHSGGDLDKETVPKLLFYRDSEESSNLFAFLEEVWKSKSLHKIGNLGEHLILDQ